MPDELPEDVGLPAHLQFRVRLADVRFEDLEEVSDRYHPGIAISAIRELLIVGQRPFENGEKPPFGYHSKDGLIFSVSFDWQSPDPGRQMVMFDDDDSGDEYLPSAPVPRRWFVIAHARLKDEEVVFHYISPLPG